MTITFPETILLGRGVLTDLQLATMRAAGLGIGGWACNDAEAIAKLLALEVDVFTTDRPDLAIAQRRGHYSHMISPLMQRSHMLDRRRMMTALGVLP